MAATPSLPPGRQRRRRADAEQNRSAILQAAAGVLNAHPDASMDDVAKASGVSRQTIYAHFPSRETLLGAVQERATEEVVAAFEAAGLEDLPPPEALIRLLDAGWAVAARYPILWHLPAVSAEEDHDRHAPVGRQLRQIIRRGQRSGDFDRTLSPDWLLAAIMALGRAAEEEVKASRMTGEEATAALRHSLLRLFGLPVP